MILLYLLLGIIALVLLVPGLLSFIEQRKRQQFRSKDGRIMQGPSVFDFFKGIIKIPDFITNQVEAKQKYGNIYCGFLATMPVVFVQDQESAKKVFLEHKQYEKASFYTEFGDAFIGQNIVILNGDEWKRIRVVMNPAFAKLDDVLLDKFVLKTRETLNLMHKQMTTEPTTEGVAVVSAMQHMTLDIIGLAAFNYDFSSLSMKSMTKEVEAYHFLFDYVFNIFHLLIPRYLSLPLAKNFAAKRHLAVFNGLIKDMIVKSKERVAKEHAPTCLLDMMTAHVDEQTGKTLTDEELRSNTVILFIAGHETTANALSFAFYVLAKHPEIQEKLRDEIMKHTKNISSDSQFDCDTVNNIEYLNYFIKETMRLYPAVTQLPMRNLVKDDVLDGYTVPKGTKVAVNIYNIHHDERYWKDPFTFDPERWTPENSQGRPFYAYIPFGGGSRLCIGNNFSLLEQRVFLAMLLREYKVEFADPNYKIQVSAGAIVATPLNLKIKLTKL